jgi:hypothetical protein
VPSNRTRPRRAAIIGTALVLLLAVASYLIYHSFQRVSSPPVALLPGCQAGTGPQAVFLDIDQAGIAATIAGVAARRKLPRQAVTIAYAAALQESRLQNLDYGDRDSVGVFQQRPSQGWGTTPEIEDPVYATTRFFDALVQLHDYTRLPVAKAAQDVQHSADGAAYGQWAPMAAELAGYFTGSSPHGVSCWYPPPRQADLAGAVRELTQTFGPEGRRAVVARITTDRSASGKDGSVAVRPAERGAAWTVAGWLVANAQAYGIGEVRYAGYEWKATDGSMGWRRDSTKQDPSPGLIVAG